MSVLEFTAVSSHTAVSCGGCGSSSVVDYNICPFINGDVVMVVDEAGVCRKYYGLNVGGCTGHVDGGDRLVDGGYRRGRGCRCRLEANGFYRGRCDRWVPARGSYDSGVKKDVFVVVLKLFLMLLWLTRLLLLFLMVRFLWC